MVQYRNLNEAFEHARRIGRPLTHHVTFHPAAAASEMEPFERLQRLLERASKWFSRRRVPFTYAYAREHRTSEKEHVHLAVHVPLGLGIAFERELTSWAVRDALHPSDPAPGIVKVTRPPEDALVRYLVKGGSELVRAYAGVSTRKPSQGVIEGRRVGVSRNIDRSARRAWAEEHEAA